MHKVVNLFYFYFTILVSMCNFRSAYASESLKSCSNYKGKYTPGITNFEIVFPQRVNKDGAFISHLVSHQHSKRSAKEKDYIFYKIPIKGKDYLIELTPNTNLISPGAVLEVYEVNNENLSSSKNHSKVDKMFEHLNIKKLQNSECHFSGQVKGENISKAALSTCYGLAGFIQIDKGFFTIEPVAEHDPFVEDAFPHILYKSESLGNSSICNTIGNLQLSMKDHVERKRRESNYGVSTPLYIETLLVMDSTFVKYHKNFDCENYILTVFNMASNLFHDASLGLLMTLTLVRLIRLESGDDKMSPKINSDAVNTLNYFQTWQYEINPGDDSHPNHHDVAVLITRVDMCYSPTVCGLLGMTTIGKACEPKYSAALCKDNGLRLGFVMAHEIGHLLGAEHDIANYTCDGFDKEGLRTVMHPQVAINTKQWSKCSQDYIKAFINSGMGSCFFDEPQEHHFNTQDLLPGVMYNADFQCKHLFTKNAKECDIGSTCESLHCHIPGYACILTHSPPADGTRCGENMWCFSGKCLMVGERPGAIDGNWGDWSAWSECSRTCGSGISSSIRLCDKPFPFRGGKYCVGESKRYKVCASMPCETGRPSFRDLQCGEYNDWIYPEDGKIHTWKAYYHHDDNPCMLYCINENKDVAALKPRVIDGTMCYRGIRDVCVAGTCKSLPCDLHFDSNAIEDVCGLCHGDGTECEFSQGIETLTKLTRGLTKLVNIPSGTRNIKVEETFPTLSKIIVSDKETKDFYIKGDTLGMFNVPGSSAWLGMIKKDQEALNIPGPITKPLTIWINRLENVTLKWSMALPAEQQRKPEFAWDFLKWGPCSAKCGPGTQKSEPSCMEEKAGLVEDTFCSDLKMPAIKVRPCEIVKCESRWMVGDWKGCEEPGTVERVRKRKVYCIKGIGEGEGESQIVLDSECPEPKPHETEPCENRQKREDSEYHAMLFDSKFRSDPVEFGFHKKYDDYLTHFAAVSVPQRNSETIPLYLVSSPHFKHYFRVLETPDDSQIRSHFYDESKLDSVLQNRSIDFKNQNRISPDFYKNTFSGNSIDVSHVESRISVRRRKHILPEVKEVQKSDSVKRYRTYKLNRKRRNLRKTREDKKTIAVKSAPLILKNKRKKNIKFKRRRQYLFRNRNPGSKTPKKCFHLKRTTKFNSQSKFENSHKLNMNSLKKLFMRKHIQDFNYTSPKLINVVENLNHIDNNMKRRYMNLISSDPEKSSFIENRKWLKYLWNPYDSPYISKKYQDFLNPFSKFVSHDLPQKLENKISYQALRPHKSMRHEYDGSGNRKIDFLAEKGSEESYAKVLNPRFKADLLEKQAVNEKRNYFSNPFDPLRKNQYNGKSSRQSFKSGVKTQENLVSERESKKLRPDILRKRNVSRRFKKKLLNEPHYNYQCRKNLKRACHGEDKRKCRRRINKVENRENFENPSDVDRRSYLKTNLFHENRAKVITKQQRKSQIEKPTINMGKLVIDKDLPSDQILDVVYEDENDYDETKPNFKTLPESLPMPKKITFKGRDVFDLFQKIQQRKERMPYPEKESDENTEIKEKDKEKIEINVKIPEIQTIYLNNTVPNYPSLEIQTDMTPQPPKEENFYTQKQVSMNTTYNWPGVTDASTTLETFEYTSLTTKAFDYTSLTSTIQEENINKSSSTLTTTSDDKSKSTSKSTSTETTTEKAKTTASETETQSRTVFAKPSTKGSTKPTLASSRATTKVQKIGITEPGESSKKEGKTSTCSCEDMEMIASKSEVSKQPTPKTTKKKQKKPKEMFDFLPFY